MRQCPNCDNALTSFLFASIALDRCDECGGLWFDVEEMQTAKSIWADAWRELDQRVAPGAWQASATQPERSRLCPACRVPMETYEFLSASGVMLDRCVRCGGNWADDGELARMAEFLERGKGHPHSAPAEFLAATAAFAAHADTKHQRSRGIAGFLGALLPPFRR